MIPRTLTADRSMKIKHHVKLMLRCPGNGFVEIAKAVFAVLIWFVVRFEPAIPKRDADEIKAMGTDQLKVAFGDPGMVKSVPE